VTNRARVVQVVVVSSFGYPRKHVYNNNNNNNNNLERSFNELAGRLELEAPSSTISPCTHLHQRSTENY